MRVFFVIVRSEVYKLSLPFMRVLHSEEVDLDSSQDIERISNEFSSAYERFGRGQQLSTLYIAKNPDQSFLAENKQDKE